MARLSLRRYETQAQLSIALALMAIVVLLVEVVLIVRNFNWSERVVLYANPRYEIAIMLLTATTGVLAMGGFYLGGNSAGQRRNEKPMLSWLGFFLNGGVLCLAVIVFFAFRTMREFVG